MSKDPYKIINAKPGWASKLASGGVAIGSVATAIVITVPGLPGYETLSQALAAGNQQELTNPSGVAQGSQTNSTSPSQVPGLNVIGSSAVPNDSKLSTSTKILSARLSLPGISTANTSSPTPLASAYSSAATGSQTSGNVSSPTPSGSTVGYEDDDYEDDEYEDEEEDD